jgi:hypothetical protein
MRSDSALNRVEQYITLFDNNYLPMGLCLHASLVAHGGAFVLWVLCMDDEVHRNLTRLALPNLRLIRLAEIESPALLGVKSSRTRAEYCWTITPFTAQFVFDRDPSAGRATYVDADVFLLDSPAPLFAELEHAGKHVLITEHAFDPRYAAAAANGRFCVQFMTFDRSAASARVMTWWQERCIEWCFARIEDGKCGDQKYLDVWPELFGDIVHVAADLDLALGPWNAEYRQLLAGGRKLRPAFFHFHGFRIVGPRRARLFAGYHIQATRWIYDRYLAAMRETGALMERHGMRMPVLAEAPESWGVLRRWVRRRKGILAYAAIR